MRAFRWWTELSTSRLPLAKIASSRSISRTLASGVLLVVLLFGARAHALPEDACIKDDKCKEHYGKAVTLYKGELFDEALLEFQAAYTARQMPLLLVNIGRTMQKLGKPKEALSYYERFLAAESKIDPDTKQRVDGYITQVKALIGPDAKSDQPPTGTTPNPLTPPPPLPPPPPPPGRNLIIAGSVVAVLGLAGIITGGALAGVSNGQYNSDFKGSNDEFDKLTAKSSIQSLDNGAVIAAILGTVTLATGGTLIGIGVRKNANFKRNEGTGSSTKPPAPAAPPPQALVIPSASGATLVLQGGF